MDYGYVIKISNKKIYREIQLQNDLKMLRIGIGTECDVRFYKELFFEKFCLTLSCENGAWQIMCSDNIYIDAGDVRKLVTKKLTHGDSFKIKYQNGETELFKVEFLIDFDNAAKKYDRVIDISNLNCITIGSSSVSNIVLNSPYTNNDRIELRKNGSDYQLRILSSACGVYHNGARAANNEIIKNGDFFSVAEFSFYLKNGRLMTDTNVNVNGLTYYDEQQKNDYPKFNRNTRVKFVVDDEKIQVLDPPAKPQKPKSNILSRLLPSLIMVVAGLAMAAFSPFMLVSSGIGVVTAVISLIQSKKDFKTNSKERIEKYNKYIENKKAEIEKDRNDEKEVLEKIYNDENTLMNRFFSFSGDLFDRMPEDEDFLCVRLGTGDVKAKKEIDYKKQEKLEVEDDLQIIPENLSKEYKYIHSAPIVCSFKDSNAIGIIGPEQYRFELMKTIIIDLCARQFPTDVNLFFVCEEQHRNKIHWLRMLPHVYNDDLGIRNIVTDSESKNVLFEYLYKELTAREQNKKYDKNIIVFLFDEYGFKNHPISKFTENAKDLGVTFVYFGNKKTDIGLNCDYLIDIQNENTASLIDTSDANNTSEFYYMSVPDNQAAAVVDLLAPVYTEEISLEGTLVKNISLFRLLNIIAVDDIDLAANWSKSQVFKSMSAPIGVSKSGVVSLDLHDKAHGPHGLVAGTTGSGKSEILQTYVLSMALLFHPYEVSFVIIDFKGGGMVNQFKDLPHLVGAITNIDGKEIDRSLKSIKAELKKRQRLFAEAEVNHIDKYIKKYKAGEVSEPLPHLILIVDEFAELKAEQPEFMKELISAARIGRSLGVHLILATQKPSGQVDDQIWSNSRFKLCLKVQDQQDSNEVLKSPLAAEIKEPGRAYLQVGNNEIFELFQSAYSGAPEKADNSNVKEFSIYSLTDSGRRIPVYQQKKKKNGEKSATQLEALVQYVHDYTEKAHIKKLPDICLPPLPEVINYSSEGAGELTVPIGIYDDPDNQIQSVYGVNVFSDNTMIIGSSQSGKTNLLQLLIRGIADHYTPQDVNIYIIDFASMVLKNFELLNFVGGVVCSNEDEKLKNLFKLITEQIEIRKQKLLEKGVSNYLSYKEAGYTDIPQIVLIIDNLTALNELYLQDNDVLLTICREGIAVGVSVVVANSQTRGIGYKYMSNFSSKIALFCNDSSEYVTLFEHCKTKLSDVRGRCIVEIEKEHYECQTYLAFEGEKEFERVEKITEFINASNEKFKMISAVKIPEIPDILSMENIEQNYNIVSNSCNLVIGLNYANVAPVILDILKQEALMISGSIEDSKTNFINYLKYLICKLNFEILILDNYKGEFEDISENSNVELYSRSVDDVKEMLATIHDSLSKRYTERELNGVKCLDNVKPVVFIVNNIDAISAISSNREILDLYKDIMKKYKGLKSLVIFTEVENQPISYSSPEVLKMIKENYQIIAFDNLADVKIFDSTSALIRKFKNPLGFGDAFYLSGNELKKIKTISKW